MTKSFNYNEVFGNHFCYRQKVNDNKNCHNYPISVKRTWATTYWHDHFHDYFLELAETNSKYLLGYLIDGADIKPQLDFWHQLVWEMVDNTPNEEEEASGVEGRRLRERGGPQGTTSL